ncbi:MAG: sulfate reduction electron transfer complex DsrMKJOP subunit DsrM [Desulfurivibrionaceae bacterium]|nr:sulfate reduction electron transfer complex DsrMKJOP subunit DsrM [Desulfobulbales bacterium]MDT8334432.1 sulfate reduction electron transfer complex DsrMKJOP subunit DsrM [Desulfurivibrionaceae bacterium]
MKVLQALGIVLALMLLAYVGAAVPGGRTLFGVVLPYLGFAVFIIFFIAKVMDWARSPVPFRIPTTAGQANSLPWIKQNKLDCPSTTSGVIGRMLLEVFLFRSLFKNTRAEIHEGPKLAYGSSKFLWLFGLLFHYSFLTIVLRHLRLFTDPVPGFVHILEFADGFMQVGAPVLYQTDIVFLGALTFLLLRRLLLPNIRYISLPADYFPLLLILGIGITGVLMRYVVRVDVISIKMLANGLVTGKPFVADTISGIFFIHMFLITVLLTYFPFSKLMHMGGVFLSPTRNLANNSRMVRHVNPWNDPSIKPHSYAGYEDEFREFMVDAGLPVEKEPEPKPAEEEAPAEGETKSES